MGDMIKLSFHMKEMKDYIDSIISYQKDLSCSKSSDDLCKKLKYHFSIIKKIGNDIIR